MSLFQDPWTNFIRHHFGTVQKLDHLRCTSTQDNQVTVGSLSCGAWQCSCPRSCFGTFIGGTEMGVFIKFPVLTYSNHVRHVAPPGVSSFHLVTEARVGLLRIFFSNKTVLPMVGCMYIIYLAWPDTHIWVFPKIMVPPNHPSKNRVFHEINHPFWDTPIFGNTHIYVYIHHLCTLWSEFWGWWIPHLLVSPSTCTLRRDSRSSTKTKQHVGKTQRKRCFGDRRWWWNFSKVFESNM